jgi:hypothetical protein
MNLKHLPMIALFFCSISGCLPHCEDRHYCAGTEATTGWIVQFDGHDPMYFENDISAWD